MLQATVLGSEAMHKISQARQPCLMSREERYTLSTLVPRRGDVLRMVCQCYWHCGTGVRRLNTDSFFRQRNVGLGLQSRALSDHNNGFAPTYSWTASGHILLTFARTRTSVNRIATYVPSLLYLRLSAFRLTSCQSRSLTTLY